MTLPCCLECKRANKKTAGLDILENQLDDYAHFFYPPEGLANRYVVFGTKRLFQYKKRAPNTIDFQTFWGSVGLVHECYYKDAGISSDAAEIKDAFD